MTNKEPSPAEYVDKRLVKRLRIYLTMMIIMLAVIAYEVLTGSVSISWALGGILIGVGVGTLVSRMYRLSWDEKTNHVIGRIDWIGAIILICYLIFTFTRTSYLSQYIQGTLLSALILSITAGTMLGRVITTDHGIKKILRALNIQIHENP
ncbi:hypothetical protein [Methanobacterium ferruginis]|uniref:hypothetical protein n=1 Tax=Methanobacterium ferruginis TaxID=710191 RepID=UPI0025736754|nr:hypothetical protein [Methanobacterium ferruginis]BDZ68802.1 hypothetical protein GCM10025860_22500 [Methanobacterium ferruginis]